MPSNAQVFLADVNLTGLGFGNFWLRSGIYPLIRTNDGMFSCVLYFSAHYDARSSKTIRAVVIVSEHVPTSVFAKGESIDFCSALGVSIATGSVVSSSCPFKLNQDYQAVAERVFAEQIAVLPKGCGD